MRISDWSSDLCSSDLARRQIVAEPHVGDFGARLGFGERAGGGDPVGGEIEGDVVRDQRVEAGFLGRVGDGEAAGERELAVRGTPVARRGGQDKRDVAGQVGTGASRERVFRYVYSSVVAAELNKKKQHSDDAP